MKAVKGLDTQKITYDYISDYQWSDSVLLSFYVKNKWLNGYEITFEPTYNFRCFPDTLEEPDTLRSLDMIKVPAGREAFRFVELEITSNPEGAKVYMIPKLVWLKNPDILEPQKHELLNTFYIFRSKTPLKTYAQEYVYIVVYELKGKFGHVEIRPNYSLYPKDKVPFDFN